MNPLADLTQAPIVYKAGADTYEVSPLTRGDYGAFARFVQMHPWYVAKDLPGIDPKKVDEIFNQCLRTPTAMNSPEFAAVAGTMEGMTEAAYLSLRHKHPSITREMVDTLGTEHIANISNIAAMLSSPLDTDEKKTTKNKVLELLRSKQLID